MHGLLSHVFEPFKNEHYSWSVRIPRGESVSTSTSRVLNASTRAKVLESSERVLLYTLIPRQLFFRRGPLLVALPWLVGVYHHVYATF